MKEYIICQRSEKMGTKKKDNPTYEFICKARDFTSDLSEEKHALIYDYIQLLDLIKKYDMGEIDTKRIVEIVYDYLDNNWRW